MYYIIIDHLIKILIYVFFYSSDQPEPNFELKCEIKSQAFI